MYSRSLNGQTLTFGVSGKLWKNALVMYDRETKTLWSHLTGEAIDGPLSGQTLTMLTSVPKVKWATWQNRHPHTRVLSIRGEEELRRDVYIDYHISNRTGLFHTERNDSRLPIKNMVIGVSIEGVQKAYPLKKKLWKHKKTLRLIMDQIGDVPVVVYHDPNSYATAVYDRRLDDTVLEFEPEVEAYIATDTQGRQWNLLTGKGPNGKTLEPIPHLRVYWFAWVDFYPQTLLYDSEK